MQKYSETLKMLENHPKTWGITGVAGFIGSNLLECLLKLNQNVIGLDNLTTGALSNLEHVKQLVTAEQWKNFSFIQGDIQDLNHCHNVCKHVDYVLHQAALGSIPRSIADPISTHNANVTGFINMLVAAKDAKVKSFVYASSSSVYGDHPILPKVEHNIGQLLSPYAATKLANEQYALVFANTYQMRNIGLRYFNVFGPRQSPNGPYAAVIPKWVTSILNSQPVYVYGDGTNSRDFCYVENAVQANILAATHNYTESSVHEVYNVAYGAQNDLQQLYNLLTQQICTINPNLKIQKLQFLPARAGDIKHSLADISKIKNHLGYHPTHDLLSGLQLSLEYYCKFSD